jgi:VanZ family protein
MAAIFAASSVSAGPAGMRLPDKWVHAGVYAVLAGLILWAMTGGEWRRLRWRMAAGATAACALYGLSDEAHQLFVPGRQFDLLDLAADASGAALAACALMAWGIISRGSRRTHGL